MQASYNMIYLFVIILMVMLYIMYSVYRIKILETITYNIKKLDHDLEVGMFLGILDDGRRQDLSRTFDVNAGPVY